MSEQRSGIYLVGRSELKKERKEARRRIMEAAAIGADIDSTDLARVRGLTVREREDSILSDAWVLIALVMLAAGFLDGRNAALLALGAVMLIVLGAGKLWKNMSLVGVLYRRSFNRTHVFPDEAVDMTISVSNNKRLPLTWLRFQDTLPVSPESKNVIARMIGDTNDEYVLVNSYSMHAYEQVDRSFRLRFQGRGFYKFGPVIYQSGDLFTLFRIEREYAYQDTIVVYPRIYPLDELGLPAKEPFGDLRIRRSLFTDPIDTRGIRDYQPQDRFRDVHWKATARRGELQTRIFEPSTGMTLGIFLNVATMPRHWMGFFPEVMERAVTVAASIASYGANLGWGIGLYANGSFPNSDQPIRVPPGRSTSQLTHVLEALAAVTEFATSSIEGLMLRESPSLPWIATIVLVTAVVTDETMAALLRLKEAGRRIVLISLAEDSPPDNLGYLLTYHIPADAFPEAPAKGAVDNQGKQNGGGIRIRESR
jgi:uncharacterized protein (DUF58 family)